MAESPLDIRLRPYAAGDFALLGALLGDEAAMRHLGGAESPEALGARHQRYLTADPLTNGLFTIVAGEERVAVGWVGFWESTFRGETGWECGWHVLPEWQGCGVAAQAARLMLVEAAARGRYTFVDAFPAIENEASNALCRALGFRDRGEVAVEYPKGHLMLSRHWRYELGEGEGE